MFWHRVCPRWLSCLVILHIWVNLYTAPGDSSEFVQSRVSSSFFTCCQHLEYKSESSVFAHALPGLHWLHILSHCPNTVSVLQNFRNPKMFNLVPWCNLVTERLFFKKSCSKIWRDYIKKLTNSSRVRQGTDTNECSTGYWYKNVAPVKVGTP